MIIVFAWNHSREKEINVGEEYRFVENLQYSTVVDNEKKSVSNIFKAIVEEIYTDDGHYRMNLKITNPGHSGRYNVNEIINRKWPKFEENHTGVIQIYNA